MTGKADRAAVPARVLLMSERNIYEQEVWRCSFKEFEDLLPALDAVDVIAPHPRSWYKTGKRVALRAGKHVATPLNPGIPPITLDRDYDLFFTVCEKPSELLNVNAVNGWKTRCRTSVCWLTEFYVQDMPLFKSCLEVLAQFDHVLFMFSAIEPFNRLIDGKGSYLAAGIDTLRFCPYPKPPARPIDVLSVGRRSSATHQALLALARNEGLFYLYDTLTELRTASLDDHRALMANLTKRSRYFLVNPSKVDEPGATGVQSEFGYRYFEGAAPGTIMLGSRPRNRHFEEMFDWEDAVIDLPYGSDQVGAIIKELDAQPERQERIRRRNVAECLRRHDWAHRWEAILALAGLEPSPQLCERKQRLKATCAHFESTVSAS